MATLNSVLVTDKEWVNILSTLSNGQKYLLQNRSPFGIYKYIGGAEAPDSDEDALLILPMAYELVTVDSSEPMWLRAQNGSASIKIEER